MSSLLLLLTSSACLLLLLNIPQASRAQTYHYSNGWNPGKRSGTYHYSNGWNPGKRSGTYHYSNGWNPGKRSGTFHYSNGWNSGKRSGTFHYSNGWNSGKRSKDNTVGSRSENDVCVFSPTIMAFINKLVMDEISRIQHSCDVKETETINGVKDLAQVKKDLFETAAQAVDSTRE